MKLIRNVLILLVVVGFLFSCFGHVRASSIPFDPSFDEVDADAYDNEAYAADLASRIANGDFGTFDGYDPSTGEFVGDSGDGDYTGGSGDTTAGNSNPRPGGGRGDLHTGPDAALEAVKLTFKGRIQIDPRTGNSIPGYPLDGNYFVYQNPDGSITFVPVNGQGPVLQGYLQNGLAYVSGVPYGPNGLSSSPRVLNPGGQYTGKPIVDAQGNVLYVDANGNPAQPRQPGPVATFFGNAIGGFFEYNPAFYLINKALQNPSIENMFRRGITNTMTYNPISYAMVYATTALAHGVALLTGQDRSSIIIPVQFQLTLPNLMRVGSSFSPILGTSLLVEKLLIEPFWLEAPQGVTVDMKQQLAEFIIAQNEFIAQYDAQHETGTAQVGINSGNVPALGIDGQVLNPLETAFQAVQVASSSLTSSLPSYLPYTSVPPTIGQLLTTEYGGSITNYLASDLENSPYFYTPLSISSGVTGEPTIGFSASLPSFSLPSYAPAGGINQYLDSSLSGSSSVSLENVVNNLNERIAFTQETNPTSPQLLSLMTQRDVLADTLAYTTLAQHIADARALKFDSLLTDVPGLIAETETFLAEQHAPQFTVAAREQLAFLHTLKAQQHAFDGDKAGAYTELQTARALYQATSATLAEQGDATGAFLTDLKATEVLIAQAQLSSDIRAVPPELGQARTEYLSLARSLDASDARSQQLQLAAYQGAIATYLREGKVSLATSLVTEALGKLSDTNSLQLALAGRQLIGATDGVFLDAVALNYDASKAELFLQIDMTLEASTAAVESPLGSYLSGNNHVVNYLLHTTLFDTYDALLGITELQTNAVGEATFRLTDAQTGALLLKQLVSNPFNPSLQDIALQFEAITQGLAQANQGASASAAYQGQASYLAVTLPAEQKATFLAPYFGLSAENLLEADITRLAVAYDRIALVLANPDVRDYTGITPTSQRTGQFMFERGMSYVDGTTRTLLSESSLLGSLQGYGASVDSNPLLAFGAFATSGLVTSMTSAEGALTLALPFASVTQSARIVTWGSRVLEDTALATPFASATSPLVALSGVASTPASLVGSSVNALIGGGLGRVASALGGQSARYGDNLVLGAEAFTQPVRLFGSQTTLGSALGIAEGQALTAGTALGVQQIEGGEALIPLTFLLTGSSPFVSAVIRGSEGLFVAQATSASTAQRALSSGELASEVATGTSLVLRTTVPLRDAQGVVLAEEGAVIGASRMSVVDTVGGVRPFTEFRTQALYESSVRELGLVQAGEAVPAVVLDARLGMLTYEGVNGAFFDAVRSAQRVDSALMIGPVVSDEALSAVSGGTRSLPVGEGTLYLPPPAESSVTNALTGATLVSNDALATAVREGLVNRMEREPVSILAGSVDSNIPQNSRTETAVSYQMPSWTTQSLKERYPQLTDVQIANLERIGPLPDFVYRGQPDASLFPITSREADWSFLLDSVDKDLLPPSTSGMRSLLYVGDPTVASGYAGHSMYYDSSGNIISSDSLSIEDFYRRETGAQGSIDPISLQDFARNHPRLYRIATDDLLKAFTPQTVIVRDSAIGRGDSWAIVGDLETPVSGVQIDRIYTNDHEGTRVLTYVDTQTGISYNDPSLLPQSSMLLSQVDDSFVASSVTSVPAGETRTSMNSKMNEIVFWRVESGRNRASLPEPTAQERAGMQQIIDTISGHERPETNLITPWNDAWVGTREQGPKTYPEGIKLVVSDPGTFAERSSVVGQVVDVLAEDAFKHVQYKVFIDMDRLNTGPQAGKFITIYTKDPAQAQLLAERLQSLFADTSFSHITKPYANIPLDEQGMLSFRFGTDNDASFSVTLISGQEVSISGGEARYNPSAVLSHVLQDTAIMQRPGMTYFADQFLATLPAFDTPFVLDFAHHARIPDEQITALELIRNRVATIGLESTGRTGFGVSRATLSELESLATAQKQVTDLLSPKIDSLSEEQFARLLSLDSLMADPVVQQFVHNEIFAGKFNIDNFLARESDTIQLLAQTAKSTPIDSITGSTGMHIGDIVTIENSPAVPVYILKGTEQIAQFIDSYYSGARAFYNDHLAGDYFADAPEGIYIFPDRVGSVNRVAQTITHEAFHDGYKSLGSDFNSLFSSNLKSSDVYPFITSRALQYISHYNPNQIAEELAAIAFQGQGEYTYTAFANLLTGSDVVGIRRVFYQTLDEYTKITSSWFTSARTQVNEIAASGQTGAVTIDIMPGLSLPSKLPDGHVLTLIRGREFGYSYDLSVDFFDLLNKKPEALAKLEQMKTATGVSTSGTGNVILGWVTKLTGFVSKLTGFAVDDTMNETLAPPAFIALCDEQGCTTLPTVQTIGGVRFELGIWDVGENKSAVFGYKAVGVGGDGSVQAIGEQEVVHDTISVTGSGVHAITDASAVVTTIPADRAVLVQTLGYIQLLTPEPAPLAVLSGSSELRGISLVGFSTDDKAVILQTLFGTASPADKATASMLIENMTHTVLYRTNHVSAGELFVSRTDPLRVAVLQPSSFVIPFMRAGVTIGVPYHQRMNGILEAGEQCDMAVPVGSTADTAYSFLEDNPSCAQNTSAIIAGQVAWRDAYGSCGLNGQCVLDRWEFGNASVMNASGARNTECTSDVQCSLHAQCVAGSCIPKTYCGDGIVQGINDEGIHEQCDPAMPTSLLPFGLSNTGQCRIGVAKCTASCTYSANLIGMVLPDLLERKDGIDNDCNGRVDEGFQCKPYDATLLGASYVLVNRTVVFTSVGTYNWTVPANVTSIIVEAWGGGGGGTEGSAGAWYSSGGGAGGGGGGYGRSVLSVSAGTRYPLRVGAGGQGGYQGITRAEQAGGVSSFGTLIAYGGAGGGVTPAGTVYPGTGGAGGSSTFDITLVGGTGGDGTSSTGCGNAGGSGGVPLSAHGVTGSGGNTGGGGGASNDGAGGSGGSCAGGVRADFGDAPGGAGGGGGLNGYGAPGAPGMVLITYTINVSSASLRAGMEQRCGSAVGACRQGTQRCSADGSWGACMESIEPVTEICDGVDNNCNGLVDEGVLEADGSCGSASVSIDNSIIRAGFVVYRATNETGPYTLAALVPASQRSFADRSISTGTTYYYKIVAFNQSVGLSDASVIVSGHA